eukprot:349929-Chlamydomonas_euryale.AAC.24
MHTPAPHAGGERATHRCGVAAVPTACLLMCGSVWKAEWMDRSLACMLMPDKQTGLEQLDP